MSQAATSGSVQPLKVALLAFGSMVAPAASVAEALDLSLVNMRFVKPLDDQVLLDMAATHDVLVSIEENAIAGGAGSAIAERLSQLGINKPLRILGLPDEFVQHGSREELLAYCKLDSEGLMQTVADILHAFDVPAAPLLQA